MNASTELHSVPFWRLAIRDPLTSGTLLLLVAACSIQAVAIVAVFWSRAHFGHQFNPETFSDYQRTRSDEAVLLAMGTVEAQKARVAAAQLPAQGQAALILERAGAEFEQARVRERDVRAAVDEMQKRAGQSIIQSDEAWTRGNYEEAFRQLQTAAEANPSYLPLMKTLATRYEERGQFEQARFQLEKIVGIAPPDSADARDAQTRIQQLALKVKESPGTDVKPIAAIPAAVANAISLVKVDRIELPSDDRYDLRFNLRITLGSRGSTPTVDVEQAKVEVTFYDRSFSAAGTLVPLKVLATTLQPKPVWTTGTQQTLALEYKVPKGYLKKRGTVFGKNYDFCGYVVRVFYRQEMQDSIAEPHDPLDVFAHRTALAAENKP